MLLLHPESELPPFEQHINVICQSSAYPSFPDQQDNARIAFPRVTKVHAVETNAGEREDLTELRIG